MKMKLKKPKVRNPLHDHPLLKKGGVHEKSKKTLRRNARQQLRKEWFALMRISPSRMNANYSNNSSTYTMARWWNWNTRSAQIRVPQGM